MTGTTYIPGSEIAAEVAQKMGDLQMRHLNRTHYMMLLRKGLDEMAMDGAYDTRVMDVDVPSTLKVKLPSGIINIIDMYLFSGSQCNISTNTPQVHFKENFHHKGGSGSFAQQKGFNGFDPLKADTWWCTWPTDQLYYGGIMNGWLFLSSNSGSFSKLHIVYKSTSNGDDEIEVPLFARQALVDYVHHEAAQYREMENPNYWARIIQRKAIELKDVNGSWQSAKARFGMMDQAQRTDMHRYLSRYPP